MGKPAATKVLKKFRRQKIMTVAELVSLLSCTSRTVRRYLSGWRAMSSYNQNGRYYTLPEIAQFDAAGFWRHEMAFFSRHGNLKETVIHLITESEAGLSGREIGEIVWLDPRSFLWHIHDDKAIKRQKVNGRFIYVSSTPGIGEDQLKARQRLERTTSRRMPNAAEAVVILVEYIKFPESSFEDLSHRARRFKIQVPPESIACFFDHHGLLKKMVE